MNAERTEPPLNILLAEDDGIDRKLLKLAIGNDGLPAKLFMVNDGEDVIQYLKGEGDYADREKFPFPDLLVLDLKMERLGGLDVLKWLRRHPACSGVPTVMLSGSGLYQDVEQAYRLGANSYFRKPSSVSDLTKLLQTMTAYWRLTERPKSVVRCA